MHTVHYDLSSRHTHTVYAVLADIIAALSQDTILSQPCALEYAKTVTTPANTVWAVSPKEVIINISCTADEQIALTLNIIISTSVNV